MNSDPDDHPGTPRHADELERPLRLLTEQEQETSPDFVAKVQRMILRRSAASQCVSFSWNMPKVVLVELAGILRHLVTAIDGRKDSQS